MSEIVFRLPSKLPYGYVELRVTNEELLHLPDPEMLGAVYASFVEAYKAGEKAGFERALQRTEVAKSNHVLTEDDHKAISKATRAVVDGDDDAAELVATALGATVLESTDSEAPWSPKMAEEKGAAAAKKPWEKGGAKPKPKPNLFD